MNDPIEAVIDSIDILVGDYEVSRKYAAKLLLKALLKNEFFKDILKGLKDLEKVINFKLK
jgi:hypothetical protein